MHLDFQTTHALLVILTISSVWIMFILSCAYVRLDHFLHLKVKKPSWMKIFPSLETMHRYILRLLYFTFIVLTLLIINGIVLAHEIWDTNWLSQPKMLAAMSTWLYFFIMLIVRFWKGLRGKNFFIWLIIGCLFLALSMYGAYAWR